jgi:branched-chain amino acid transport system substrate-binding protein
MFVIWAGGNNPLNKHAGDGPGRASDIEMASGGNILVAMAGLQANMPGMEGATYYYYEIPQNPINDWLVEQHFRSVSATPPDFFTAGGMSAAMAVVDRAAQLTEGSTDDRRPDRGHGGHGVRDAQGHDAVPRRRSSGAAIHVSLQASASIPTSPWGIPELVRELTHRRHGYP